MPAQNICFKKPAQNFYFNPTQLFQKCLQKKKTAAFFSRKVPRQVNCRSFSHFWISLSIFPSLSTRVSTPSKAARVDFSSSLSAPFALYLHMSFYSIPSWVGFLVFFLCCFFGSYNNRGSVSTRSQGGLDFFFCLLFF